MSPIKAGVIGHPVAHSLSPVMHNAAYEHLGLDWNYQAIDIEPGDVVTRVNELFANGYGGLNVTMPHKDVAYTMSTAHGAASRLCTVNTLVSDSQGSIHGYSTDGDGFVASMKENKIDVIGKRILVIGAGGASRSICDALVHAGAQVFVTARKLDQALDLVEVVMASTTNSEMLSRGSIDIVEFSQRSDAACECDIVVNATPVGMTRDGSPDMSVPIDVSGFSGEEVVVDTVYYPIETELLRLAKEQGCRTVNGLGMLIHQGALSFTLMTEQAAPIDVMRKAIHDHLADISEVSQ
ncbi:MAG TPA: shikimate dehydrogenase [Acidimicrobiia bacterium]|nr:shikimate dehydrogenase [Acidimicrobiia bacterium]